jgi:hypothetical protein
MLKKVIHMLLIVSLLFGFAGCSLVGNDGKTVSNQAAQKEANGIKDSAVPDFDEMYNSTVEIEVNFDPNGMYKDFQAIKINDGKMLSDILAMIGKSQVIDDESEINNMSGMAAKENRLILKASDGNKKEIKFAFDDPAFAVGYLEIGETKYDPGFSFFRYIKDFTKYRQFDTDIEDAVAALFGKYNWTVDYKVGTSNETLPADLKHAAGGFPVEIYWAYNNELSKDIGLDYTCFLSKKVQVEIYRLREPLPDYMHPRMNARGIVMKYEDKIVGAYIDAGRHDSFACSLDRESLQGITGREWDQWVSDHIDYNNELEMKLSKMAPEEIIQQYYDAMNRHDQKMQFACMTRKNLCNYLAANMDNNRLINESFDDVFMDGEGNVKSVKLIDVREMSGMDNEPGMKEYAVTVDYQFKKEITSSSGEQPRFLILKKESAQSGWRIHSEGTGP